MAPTRLLDQDAQRERRNQQLLQERLSRTAERLIGREIASTTRDMARKWEVSGQVPEPGEHVRRMDSLMRRIWRAAVEGMAKRVNEAAKGVGRPSVTKQEAKWDLFVDEYITTWGGEKIVQVTETTRDQVMTMVLAARREGLGQREAAKKIADRADAIARQRAAVIARTETHAAGNYGAMQQARDTGLDLQKEWIAASGERTRSSHQEADGQVVAQDEPFIVDGEALMFPGDPNGSAGNVISCRCAMGYVVAE